LVEHLVALVQDKLSNVTKLEMLVTDKGIETAWGADDNVGVGLLVPQNVDVLIDLSAAIEYASLDIRHVLAKPLVLGTDLVCQLAGMAHDEYGGFTLNRLDLLKRRKDEDCGLTKTRLCLADDVGTQDGLRNALSLDCGVGLLDDDRLKSVCARERSIERASSIILRSISMSKPLQYDFRLCKSFRNRNANPPLAQSLQLYTLFQTQSHVRIPSPCNQV
jgi:hypothetical protein